MMLLRTINKKLKGFLRYPKKFGALKGTHIWYLFKYERGDSMIQLDSLQYPVKVRLETTDKYIFDQIFLREDYNFSINFSPKFILDVGANVGYSVVYFANKYPDAAIIAIEPHKGNFQLLKENTKYYRGAKNINAALWNKNTTLEIIDRGLGEWGFTIIENNDPTADGIKAITIDEIMSQAGRSTIDILKMDIEGTEKEIFSENYEKWLPNTRVLIVELHDDIKEGCSKVFYHALSKYNFSTYENGENIFCFNQDL